jgi:hypothetical protein
MRYWSRGSSVGIVSGYGLDNRAIQMQSPAEAKDFFPLASVSRPALGPTQPPIQWVLGVLFPGVKCSQGVTLITHPHLVPRSWMSRSYASSPPCTSIGVLWDCFTFTDLLTTYYVAVLLLCLDQSQQSAELAKEPQAAATKDEEVKSVSHASVPSCGTNGNPGIWIMYCTHWDLRFLQLWRKVSVVFRVCNAVWMCRWVSSLGLKWLVLGSGWFMSG